MTPEEAIEDLQYLITEYEAYPPETGVCTTIGTLQYVISTLKEIQQYREIGTVEECREGVEKKWPKKPEASDGDFDYYKCPACGACIWGTDCVQDHNYCLNCGQAIDWEESGEE